jgi:hypothetical protein
MEDDVDAQDSIDLDGDVDMERDGEDEEDEEEEDEKEVEVVDEDEEEDENNGKEPQTIGLGELVNASADDADTMVDDPPTMLPEQGQEMHEHTPRPQPPAAAPWPPTLEPRPRPRNQETDTLTGLEFMGLRTQQNPRPAAPTLRIAKAAGNISDLDVEQQLLGEMAGGDSLPDVRPPVVPPANKPLPNVPLLDVPLPNVPLRDVPLPHVPISNVPLSEARPDGWVREE